MCPIPVKELRTAAEVREHALMIARRICEQRKPLPPRVLVPMPMPQAPEAFQPAVIEYPEHVREAVTAALEKAALKPAPEPKPEPKPVEEVPVIAPLVMLNMVARQFGMSRFDITGERRSRHYVTARHVACFVAVRLLRFSYPRVGRLIGGRDHTTVLNAVRRINKRMSESEEFSAMVNDIGEAVACAINRTWVT